MNENIVKLTIEGNIATLELNRPEVYNALNVQMLEGIVAGLKKVKESPAEILILKGNGKGFCAGGDIKSMLISISEPEFYRVMDIVKEMMTILYTLPKLTISAIHGPVAGLGFSIVLATDYVIASERAIFAMNFIGIGLVPDGGGHFFLKERVGEHKAKQIIWEGKNLGALEAHQLGFVDEVVETNLNERVEQKIAEWQEKPRIAMLKTKEILTQENLPSLLKILDLEKDGQCNVRLTKDHQEGIKAFIEKRKPVYQGE